ncbi:MAG: Flp pilus assembly complex ATPase component TadA [Gemmatimonadetes bacterium]|nr:Flp pilus assembly complex ATPase component TadA [Gemmatimonadota bacterium]
MATKPTVLGRLLVAEGHLREEPLREALDEQARSGGRLGEVLQRRGAVDEETVARVLAIQLGLPYAEPPLVPRDDALALVRPRLARERRVLPLEVSGSGLRLAVADPLDAAAVDDVRFQCGRRVDPVVASMAAVAAGLAAGYGGDVRELIEALPRDPTEPEEDGGQALEAACRSAPVVRLVDHVLQRAVEERASDIHVEETGGDVRVRYRVDGVLREALGLPRSVRRAVLSRIKIMAGMDIAVRRRPQDGGLELPHGERRLTLRVSTLPVGGGEKAVVRILDPREGPRDLGALGVAPDDLVRLRGALAAGQGVLLAAGPTGSGKSSTLVAALREIDRERLNVVTLEDPVEHRLPGVSQVQVRPKAGLTFPAALRSVLRQDPDVVMVGEIRDRETAEIAMTAAVTGHLVLSTIHTTDAPGAVARLLDMGVAPYLVAGGLAGVVAQRLVRVLCRACRGRDGGCGRCRDGYRGRTGVFQVLVMGDALRDEVTRGAGTTRLRSLAAAGGMGTLVDDARRKVAEGVTTPHEVARVIPTDPGASLPCRGCGGEMPADAAGCPGCGRPRHRVCRCGRVLQEGWRFCPACLARA